MGVFGNRFGSTPAYQSVKFAFSHAGFYTTRDVISFQKYNLPKANRGHQSAISSMTLRCHNCVVRRVYMLHFQLQTSICCNSFHL